jgi:septal ring factor EnvC (AmiA/AmiB activator)
MENIVQAVVLTMGTIAAVAGMIKWGIEKYFKKSEEVMRLKEELNQKSIKTIETSMDRVAGEIINLGQNMSELEQHLIIFNSRLQEYDKQNHEVLKSYISLSSEIRRKLQVFEGLELYEFKDNLYVFRKKNH